MTNELARRENASRETARREIAKQDGRQRRKIG